MGFRSPGFLLGLSQSGPGFGRSIFVSMKIHSILLIFNCQQLTLLVFRGLGQSRFRGLGQIFNCQQLTLFFFADLDSQLEQSRTNCPCCRRRRSTSRSRQQQLTSTLTPLRPPAVRARLPLRPHLPILCIIEAPRFCTRGECGALAQNVQTQRNCASLQRRGGRVVWQVHEVQEALGNKDHLPASTALSTV